MDTILSENWGKSLISLNLVPANKSVLKVFQGLVSVLISDVRILILEVSDGRVPLYVECVPCWCVIILMQDISLIQMRGGGGG